MEKELTTQTEIPTTMYAYLKKQTKINPHEVEEKYVALIESEEYKKLAPKKVEKIIALHSEYIEFTAKSIHERAHVSRHKRMLKQADKALDANKNDEMALNNKEISSTDLIGHNAEYDKNCHDLSESLIALDKELNEYIAAYNAKNSEHPFVKAIIPVKTAKVKKKQDVSIVKPTTACTALVPVSNNQLPTAVELYGKQNAAQASFAAGNSPLNTEEDKDISLTPPKKPPVNMGMIDSPQKSAIPALGPAKAPATDNKPKRKKKEPSTIKAPGKTMPEPESSQEPPKPDQGPAPEKAPDKAPEKKPEVKKTELITTSLAFLIAAITFGLLIAGVGVAGWFVPALCATSAVIAAGGSGVLTLHYIDEKKPKKSKEQKAKDRLQKAMDKQKAKELKKQRKQNKQQTKAQTKQAKANINKQTPQIKNTQAQAGTSSKREPIVADYTPAKENITNTTTTQGVTQENLQALKDAITLEKSLRNDTSRQAEHEQAVEKVIKLTQALNPENSHVLTFAEEDQSVIQGCNDILTAYIANGSAISDTEETTSNLSSTSEVLSKKPKSKKAKQAYAGQAEDLDYNQDVVNKTLNILNEKIDILNEALDEKLGIIEEKISTPKQKTKTAIIPKIFANKPKAAKETSHDTAIEQNEKIVNLKNKFDTVVENRGNNSQQDYTEVVKMSKEIIDDLKTKENLTPEEKRIKELCERLVAKDDSRAEIEASAAELKRDLEKLELDGEKDPDKKDEHKIEETKTKLNEKAEEHLNTMDSTKEILHDLGNQVKSYIDGTTYSKENDQEQQK